VQVFGDRLHAVADAAPGDDELRRRLADGGAALHAVRAIPPTMEDVFMHLQREAQDVKRET